MQLSSRRLLVEHVDPTSERKEAQHVAATTSGLEVRLLEGDLVADDTVAMPTEVEEPRIWKAVLRLLDEQEPRSRTS